MRPPRRVNEMDWDESYPPAQYGSQRYRSIFSDDEDDALPQRWKTPSAISLTPSTTATYVDPLLSSTTYHIHQAENALSTLKHVVMEDGWKKALKHKSGVVVHMKSGLHKGDKTPIFKGEAIIHNFSPQSVFYVIGMRKLWDEQYEDGNLVENLNETTSLTYEVTKPTATSKSRDFALVERIECTQNGSIIFAATSVETPRLPRIQGRTRAHIKLQGWILEPLRSQGAPATKVTFVVQETMKGWVPGFAKKSLARRPLVIALINDYLQKKSERVRAQSKSSLVVPLSQGRSRQPSLLSPFAPSLTDVSKTNGSHSPTPSQRSMLLGSTFSSGSTTNKKRITFASQDTTFPNSESVAESLLDPSIDHLQHIPNASGTSPRLHHPHAPSNAYVGGHPLQQQQQQQHQQQQPLARASSSASQQQPSSSPQIATVTTIPPSPSSHRLYPTHRHPGKKAQCVALLKQLFPLDQRWQLQKEDGNIRSYVHANNFVRADGVIAGNWTSEQLCSIVQCMGARKIWDDAFQHGDILERFSQKDYLVRWTMHQGDSFTVISTLDTDSSNGAIISASTSVDDPQVHPGTRQVQLAGWVFVPRKDTKGVSVSFIIDNHTFQPMPALKGLFHYLSHHGCPPYIRRVAGKVTHEQFDGQTHAYAIEYIAKHEPSASYRARKQQPEKNWCTDIRLDLAHTYPAGYDLAVSPQAGTRVEVAESYIKVYTSNAEMEGKQVSLAITASKAYKITCNGVVALHVKGADQSLQPQQPQPSSPAMAESSSSTASTPASPMPSNLSLQSTATVKPQQQQPAIKEPKQPVMPPTPPMATPTLSAADVPASEPKTSATSATSASTTTATHQRTSSTTIIDDPTQVDVPKGYVLVPQHQSNNIVIISEDLTFNGQQLAVMFIAMVICYYCGKFACTC
ncbi:hypothetical protein BC940DRAFT_312715 [Gongronella butleri]|nr:hypothetical protein BC940DRAFT_312715 [Gongronella butleri]